MCLNKVEADRKAMAENNTESERTAYELQQ